VQKPGQYNNGKMKYLWSINNFS